MLLTALSSPSSLETQQTTTQTEHLALSASSGLTMLTTDTQDHSRKGPGPFRSHTTGAGLFLVSSRPLLCHTATTGDADGADRTVNVLCTHLSPRRHPEPLDKQPRSAATLHDRCGTLHCESRPPLPSYNKTEVADGANCTVCILFTYFSPRRHPEPLENRSRSAGSVHDSWVQ